MNYLRSLLTAILPALFIAGVVAASTTISQNIVTEGDLTVGGSVGIGKTSGIDDTLSIFGTLGLAPDATSSPDVRLQRGGAGNLQFIGAHTISTTAGNLTLNPSGGQVDVTGSVNATAPYLGDGSQLSGLQASIGEELVSYWKFEGNLLDTGFTQNLSLGAGTETYVDSPLGQALDFDGSTYYTASDADYDFERTDSFSFEFWIITNSATANLAILGKEQGSPLFRGYVVGINDGGISGSIGLTLRNDNGTSNDLAVRTGTTAVNDGQPHHVVVSYDGSSLPSGIKIYLDTVLQSHTIIRDSLTSTILNDEILEVGARRSGNFKLEGQLPHVRVYTTELTTEQVKTLFHAR